MPTDAKVAEAFIELRAERTEFDKALKKLAKDLKKPLKLNVDTKQAEAKLKKLAKDVQVGAKVATGAPVVGAGVAGAATTTAAAAVGAALPTSALRTRYDLALKGNEATLEELRTRLKNIQAIRSQTPVQQRLNSIRKRAVKTQLREIKETEKAITSTSKLNTVTSKLTSGKIIGAAAVLGFTRSLIQLSKGALAAADRIDNLSKIYDITAASVQSLNILADRSGVSFETVAEAINKIRSAQAQALQGNENFTKAFEVLGVTLSDLKSLGTEQLVNKISKALSTGGVSSAELAASTALFGEQAAKVNEIFKQVNGSLDDVNKKTVEAGLVLSDAWVQAGDRAEEFWERQGRRLDTFTKKLGIAFTAGVPEGERAVGQFQAVSIVAKRQTEEYKDAIEFEEQLNLKRQSFIDSLNISKTAQEAINNTTKNTVSYYESLIGKLKQARGIIIGTAQVAQQGALDRAFSLSLINEDLELQVDSIQSANDKLREQLSIIDRIRGTFSQIAGAAGISDFFQRTITAPAVTPSEFAAAGRPGISLGNEAAIREQINLNDKSVAKIEETVQQNNDMIDELRQQTEFAGQMVDGIKNIADNLQGGLVFGR